METNKTNTGGDSKPSTTEAPVKSKLDIFVEKLGGYIPKLKGKHRDYVKAGDRVLLSKKYFETSPFAGDIKNYVGTFRNEWEGLEATVTRGGKQSTYIHIKFEVDIIDPASKYNYGKTAYCHLGFMRRIK